MAKTGAPTAKVLLHALCVFLVKHRTSIVGAVGSPADTYIGLIITNCNLLVDLIEIAFPLGD